MANAYLDCSSSAGRCGNIYHDHAKIGEDGQCRVSRAWAKEAKPCPGCEMMVPEHMGFRLPHRLLTEFAAGNVLRPKIQSTDLPFFTAVMRPEKHVCGDCATRVRNLLPGSRIDLKNGDSIPVFVTAEDYNRIVGALQYKEREEARMKAEAERQHAEVADQSRRKDEDRQRRAQEYRVGLVRRIKAGNSDGVIFSRTKKEDGVILTECAIHANAPNYCVCGGWNEWEHMPAVVDKERLKAFGVGAACAAAISEGFQEFPFLCALAVAIAACRSGDPDRYLRERREREEGRASMTFTRDQSSGPHREGYGTTRRTPQPKPPRPLSPEEQAQREREREAEKRKRQAEREMKQARMATDLRAGAMAPQPKKKEKQDKSKKKEKRGRRGANAPGAQAAK